MSSDTSNERSEKEVVQQSLVRPYVDGESLVGRLMCYHCRFSFPIPKIPEGKRHLNPYYINVTCPNCKKKEQRCHLKAANTDPLKNRLGWPYDDPTISYDC